MLADRLRFRKGRLSSLILMGVVAVLALWLMGPTRQAEACNYTIQIDTDTTSTSIPGGGTVTGKSIVGYQWLLGHSNWPWPGWTHYYCVEGQVSTKSTVDVTYSFWGGKFYTNAYGSWDLEFSTDNDCVTCRGGTWVSEDMSLVPSGVGIKTNGVHKAWQGAWVWYRTTEASYYLF